MYEGMYICMLPMFKCMKVCCLCMDIMYVGMYVHIMLSMFLCMKVCCLFLCIDMCMNEGMYICMLSMFMCMKVCGLCMDMCM